METLGRSNRVPTFTLAVMIMALQMNQVFTLPTNPRDPLEIKSVTETSENWKVSPSEPEPEIPRGYIKVPLDDTNIKELSAFATEEIRKQRNTTDLALKATVFALKKLTTANSKIRDYKLTLVMTRTGKKVSTRSLLCNVDVIYGATVDQRRAKIDCLKSNIVSGIRSISSNGTVDEDADLAAAIFAANQLERLKSTMNDNSSPPVLMHYTASLLEMISGTEFRLQMQVKGSAVNDPILVCDANVLPRKPRVLHKAHCGPTESNPSEDFATFDVTNVEDADVKETAEFVANALTQKRGRLNTDRLGLVQIDKAWKRPVRGIQRRLRMTLSHDAEGLQPSSYCYAVVFEDRLSGEYKLVTSPGTSICSSTPPTD